MKCSLLLRSGAVQAPYLVSKDTAVEVASSLLGNGENLESSPVLSGIRESLLSTHHYSEEG